MNEDNLETADLEVSAEQKVQNDGLEKEVTSTTTQLPEKFKGKSLEEVITSYTELEKAYGKQGQAFGELRKTADQFLIAKLTETSTSPAKVEEEEEVDFLEAPEKAVTNIVDRKLSETNAALERLRRKEMQTDLEKNHPDYAQMVTSPEFQSWVSDSKYRMGLFQSANHKYDYEAANELFSTWKALQAAKPKEEEGTPEQKVLEKRERINKLSTETGGTGQASTKVFSRKELIRLRSTNPKRYQQLASVIRQAYAEGRVRD